MNLKSFSFLQKPCQYFYNETGIHTVAKITSLTMIYLLNCRLNTIQAYQLKLTQRSIKIINNCASF